MREYVEGKTRLKEGEKILTVDAAPGAGSEVFSILGSVKVEAAHALGEIFWPADLLVVTDDEIANVMKRVEQKAKANCSLVKIGVDRVEIQVRASGAFEKNEWEDLDRGPDPGDKVWSTPEDWARHNYKKAMGEDYKWIVERLNELGADSELARRVFNMREELFANARNVQRKINTRGARVWVRIKESYEFEHQKKYARTPIFKVDANGQIKPVTLTDVRKWISKVNKGQS